MILDKILKNVNSVAISGHINPDGDCIGSCLGIYGYIVKNYPQIEASVYLEKPSDKMAFLKYYDVIKSNFADGRSYELMLCVDCASRERLGGSAIYFDKAKRTVNIDHHISNPSYADENYVFGGLSSCCEALYDLMDPDKIDRDIAVALYMGIISDTGVFKYDATTPKTMRVAADLMEYGIDTNFVIDESFYSKTYPENRIMGYALEKSCILFDGKLIYSTVTFDDLRKYGAKNNELDGIVAQLRLTKGTQIAIFMHEIGDHRYKISFRSGSEVDVNKIAMKFGGGGHIRASGATIEGELEECIAKVIDAAKEELI